MKETKKMQRGFMKVLVTKKTKLFPEFDVPRRKNKLAEILFTGILKMECGIVCFMKHKGSRRLPTICSFDVFFLGRVFLFCSPVPFFFW